MPTLDWIGKKKVENHHLDVPFRVLKKIYTFSANGNAIDSENMIIHGDNLEALKALLPRYENKIDCIYIDPPYNTGNKTWVYNDNVDDVRIKKWFKSVVGKEGEDLARDDKWLCMMYPRLKLLQKLLSTEGVIFISIDDYEQNNLKSICNEIFGKQNFVAQFIWYIDGHTDNQDEITNVHEYILCYAKEKAKLHFNNVISPHVSANSKIMNSYAENSITKNGPKNPASQINLPIGFPCEIENLKKQKHENVDELISDTKRIGYIDRSFKKKYNIEYPARLDDMIVKDYKLIKPCRVFSGWMNNGKLKKFIENNFESIIDDDGSKVRFFLSKNGVLYYRREERETHYIQTVLEKMGTTETNKYMLENMGIKFDYPKPYTLIEFLLSTIVKDNSIVLDSFAGSGTTGHSVISLNSKDKDRKKLTFILIEMEDYAETTTAKRIKCVSKGYSTDKTKIDGLGGDFSFYELGEPLLRDGYLNEKVDIQNIREYIWFTETNTNLPNLKTSEEEFFLGNNHGTAYFFYYKKEKATTLDMDFLATIKNKYEQYIIYADICLLPKDFMQKNHIIFKKIPRDIKKF